MKIQLHIPALWMIVTAFSIQPINEGNISTWAEYNLPGIGTIEIPSTLEVQHYGITAFTEYIQDRMKLNTDWEKHFVAQQKGLNEGLGTQKSNTYARVMLMSMPTTPGYETKLYQNPGYTLEDLNQYTSDMKYSVEQIPNMEVLEIYYTKQVIINEHYALSMKYKRQLSNNPPVIVTTYQFTNYDYEIMLMLSYREQDANLYKGDFDRITSSFKITDIR